MQLPFSQPRALLLTYHARLKTTGEALFMPLGNACSFSAPAKGHCLISGLRVLKIPQKAADDDH